MEGATGPLSASLNGSRVPPLKNINSSHPSTSTSSSSFSHLPPLQTDNMRVSRALIDLSEAAPETAPAPESEPVPVPQPVPALEIAPALEHTSTPEPVSKRLKITFNPKISAQGATQPQAEIPKAVAGPGKRAAKRGTRKRGKDSEDETIRADAGSSDSEGDVVPAATQTRSGRAVKPPTAYAPVPNTEPASTKATSAPATTRKRKHVYRKNDANVVCRRCQRGNSPATNAIVFCDECNGAWHQKCHTPPIDDEVIRVKDTKWFCHECKPVFKPASKSTKPATQMTNAQGTAPKKQQEQTKSTQPPKAPQLEVGGSQFSAAERLAYLSYLSHASLVELLVNISDSNPTVPMFPANMKEFGSSAFVQQPTSTSNTSTSNTSTLTNTTTRACTRNATTSDTSKAKTRKRSQTASSSEQPKKRTRTTSAPADLTTTSPVTSTNTYTVKTRKRSRTASSTEEPRKRARSTSNSADATTTTTTASSRGRARSRSRTTSVSTPSAAPRTRSRAASVAPTADPAAPGTSASNNSNSLADLQEEEVEEVEDHRLYPPAGSGFRASSDPSDLDILREDEDCATFSHSLHGPAKANMPAAV